MLQLLFYPLSVVYIPKFNLIKLFCALFVIYIHINLKTQHSKDNSKNVYVYAVKLKVYFKH